VATENAASADGDGMLVGVREENSVQKPEIGNQNPKNGCRFFFMWPALKILVNKLFPNSAADADLTSWPQKRKKKKWKGDFQLAGLGFDIAQIKLHNGSRDKADYYSCRRPSFIELSSY